MLRFEKFSKINILSDARRRFVTHMAVLACGGSSVNNCVPKAKSSWKFGLVGKDHMNFFLSLEMLHVCSHASLLAAPTRKRKPYASSFRQAFQIRGCGAHSFARSFPKSGRCFFSGVLRRPLGKIPSTPAGGTWPGFLGGREKIPSTPAGGGNLERRGWAGVVRGAGKGKRPGGNPVPRGRRGGKQRYGCIFL